MRITFGRRQQRCGHTRVEPHTARKDGLSGEVTVHVLCMDCARPVVFKVGRMKNLDDAGPLAMRANGYMQNAANLALWEKVV